MIALGVLTKLKVGRSVRKQSRGWRNRWRALCDGRYTCCGQVANTGQVYWECRCIPAFKTKGEAEADAVDDILCQIQRHGRLVDEWVGAFPVEERP